MGANNTSLGRHTSRSSCDVSGAANLPSITFHPNHGDNVTLLRNGAVAKRAESFCKGIAFSNRPVQINEKVFLRFAETSANWSGVLRLGFTNVDPATMRGNLPKFACPDLTNKTGFWAKAVAERHARSDAVLFFYVAANGDVRFGIDGEDKGIFLAGVDTSRPLWALMDIYGNTIAVELLDQRTQLNNARRTTSPSIYGTERNMEETIYYAHCRMEPVPFHAVHGRNVQLRDGNRTARRSDVEYACGYVFAARQLRPDERIVVKVLETESSYCGSMAFGLTACNPAMVSPPSLPEDSDLLLDRPEYWVVLKDVSNAPLPGDELGFAVDEDGKVLFYKNGHPPVTIMHVDQTQRLWPFFDVYGNTLEIHSLGIVEESAARMSSQTIHEANDSNELRVALPPAPPVPLPKLVTDVDRTSYGSGGSSPTSIEADCGLGGECVVCYEKAVDSVLYACGHMCMCYACASELRKRDGGGLCPICRAPIKDVIRPYRS